MSEGRYEIRFRGELAPGNNLVEVKRQLAGVFGLAASQVEQLFSGRELVIKRGLAPQQAQRFVAAIEKAGALCSVTPESASSSMTTLSSPPPRGHSQARVQPDAEPASPASSTTTAVADVPPLPAPSAGDVPAGAAGRMICPKCQVRQPASDVCMACGVVIAKYAERSSQKQGMPELVRRLLAAHRPAMASPRAFFSPDIPPDKLETALGIYAAETTVWPDKNREEHLLEPEEEVLLLIDTTLRAGNAKSNLMLTTKRLLYAQTMLVSNAWGFRLEEIRTAELGGISKSVLKINSQKLDLATLSGDDEIQANVALLAFFKDLVQVVKRRVLPESILAEAAARAAATRPPGPATAEGTVEGIPEKKTSGGIFAPEKKGIEKGMAGGVTMMVIAVIWFGIGMKMGIIFLYPPILFLIGLYAMLKGLLTGNISGKK